MLPHPPDTSSDPYIRASKTVDDLFLDLARLMANPDVCPAHYEFGCMAWAALESTDRLTVLKAQAQVLLRAHDILNSGEVT